MFFHNAERDGISINNEVYSYYTIDSCYGICMKHSLSFTICTQVKSFDTMKTYDRMIISKQKKNELPTKINRLEDIQN